MTFTFLINSQCNFQGSFIWKIWIYISMNNLRFAFSTFMLAFFNTNWYFGNDELNFLTKISISKILIDDLVFKKEWENDLVLFLFAKAFFVSKIGMKKHKKRLFDFKCLGRIRAILNSSMEFGVVWILRWRYLWKLVVLSPVQFLSKSEKWKWIEFFYSKQKINELLKLELPLLIFSV